ncbi:MAG: RNA polymerase sigma factor [Gemmatimonadetes bacterium]|nr:RNA polymerase sigma factor [Gemmatimonadota bacterium]MXX71013.1 RNA polymerase sigma factor [Gemmatimonadota bacterium]MYC90885.1 RNA polymerase sigma factor [Gemmatimonadota bacterium]
MSSSHSAAAPKLGPLVPGTMAPPGARDSRAADPRSATNHRPLGVSGSTTKDPARDRRLGSVTEAQLIQRLKDGDQSVARTLYDSHVDRIFRLCYRFAGEYDLAQDFTQETFVRAFTKIGMFRGEAAFGTWIAAIATTVSLNELRRIKRFRNRETPLNDELRGRSPSSTIEPDVKEDLYRAIDRLPERSRAVFVLHDVEGYTHEEIGTILGIHPGTSKSQLSRARARLRKALAVHASEWKS